MKIKRILFIIITSIFVFSLISCIESAGEDDKGDQITLDKVEIINKVDTNIFKVKGTVFELEIDYLVNDKSINDEEWDDLKGLIDVNLFKWTTSEQFVVGFVDNEENKGLKVSLKALRVGKSTITVIYDDNSNWKTTFNIEVTEEQYEVGIEDDTLLNNIKLGNRFYINDFKLENIDKVDKDHIEFKSSNNNLVEVFYDENGNFEFLEVVGIGEGTITISHKFGNFSNNLNINFKTIFRDEKIGQIIKKQLGIKDDIVTNINLNSSLLTEIILINTEIDTLEDLNYLPNLNKVGIYDVTLKDLSFDSLRNIKHIILENVILRNNMGLKLNNIPHLESLTIRNSVIDLIDINTVGLNLDLNINNLKTKNLNAKNVIFNLENQSITDFEISNSVILDSVNFENLNFLKTLVYEEITLNNISDKSDLSGLFNIERVKKLEIVDMTDNRSQLFNDSYDPIKVDNFILDNTHLSEEYFFDNFIIDKLEVTNSNLVSSDFDNIKGLKKISLNNTGYTNLSFKKAYDEIVIDQNRHLLSFNYESDIIDYLSKVEIYNNNVLNEITIQNARLNNKNFLNISNLSNLKVLRVNNTKIKDISTIDFDSLPKLETLDLSNNNITIISSIKIDTLITLDLSNNQIVQDEIDNLISVSNRINKLDLSNNLLKLTSFSVHLQNLDYLDLSNNNISRISALTSIKGLRTLHIHNNAFYSFQNNDLKGILDAIKSMNIRTLSIGSEEVFTDTNETLVRFIQENSEDFPVLNIHNLNTERVILNNPNEFNLIDSSIDDLIINSTTNNNDSNHVISNINTPINNLVIKSDGAINSLDIMNLSVSTISIIDTNEITEFKVSDDTFFETVTLNNSSNFSYLKTNKLILENHIYDAFEIINKDILSITLDNTKINTLKLCNNEIGVLDLSEFNTLNIDLYLYSLINDKTFTISTENDSLVNNFVFNKEVLNNEESEYKETEVIYNKDSIYDNIRIYGNPKSSLTLRSKNIELYDMRTYIEELNILSVNEESSIYFDNFKQDKLNFNILEDQNDVKLNSDNTILDKLIVKRDDNLGNNQNTINLENLITKDLELININEKATIITSIDHIYETVTYRFKFENDLSINFNTLILDSLNISNIDNFIKDDNIKNLIVINSTIFDDIVINNYNNLESISLSNIQTNSNSSLLISNLANLVDINIKNTKLFELNIENIDNLINLSIDKLNINNLNVLNTFFVIEEIEIIDLIINNEITINNSNLIKLDYSNVSSIVLKNIKDEIILSDLFISNIYLENVDSVKFEQSIIENIYLNKTIDSLEKTKLESIDSSMININIESTEKSFKFDIEKLNVSNISLINIEEILDSKINYNKIYNKVRYDNSTYISDVESKELYIYNNEYGEFKIANSHLTLIYFENVNVEELIVDNNNINILDISKAYINNLDLNLLGNENPNNHKLELKTNNSLIGSFNFNKEINQINLDIPIKLVFNSSIVYNTIKINGANERVFSFKAKDVILDNISNELTTINILKINDKQTLTLINVNQDNLILGINENEIDLDLISINSHIKNIYVNDNTDLSLYGLKLNLEEFITTNISITNIDNFSEIKTNDNHVYNKVDFNNKYNEDFYFNYNYLTLTNIDEDYLLINPNINMQELILINNSLGTLNLKFNEEIDNIFITSQTSNIVTLDIDVIKEVKNLDIERLSSEFIKINNTYNNLKNINLNNDYIYNEVRIVGNLIDLNKFKTKILTIDNIKLLNDNITLNNNNNYETVNILNSSVYTLILNKIELDVLNVDNSKIMMLETISSFIKEIPNELSLNTIYIKNYYRIDYLVSFVDSINSIKDVVFENNVLETFELDQFMQGRDVEKLIFKNNDINNITIVGYDDVELTIKNNKLNYIDISNNSFNLDILLENNFNSFSSVTIKNAKDLFNWEVLLSENINYLKDITISNSNFLDPDVLEIIKKLIENNRTIDLINLEIDYLEDNIDIRAYLRNVRGTTVYLSYQGHELNSEELDHSSLEIMNKEYEIKDFSNFISNNNYNNILIKSSVDELIFSNPEYQSTNIYFIIEDRVNPLTLIFDNVEITTNNRTIFDNLINFDEVVTIIAKNKVRFSSNNMRNNTLIDIYKLKFVNYNNLDIDVNGSSKDILSITSHSLILENYGILNVTSKYNGKNGIDGEKGENGKDGINGVKNGIVPTAGRNGTDGKSGTYGEDGSHAIKIKGFSGNISLINHQGRIIISAGDGGRGGNGGNGGNGGRGGNGRDGTFLGKKSTDGENGGNAGNGGNAASGGRGGKAVYKTSLSSEIIETGIDIFIIDGNDGLNGTPGKAGFPGSGGRAGNKVTSGNRNPGLPGKAGRDGRLIYK